MSNLDPTKMSRRQQVVETFRMTRQVDPAVTWWMVGGFVVFGAIGFGLFWLLPGGGVAGLVIAILGGILLGLLGLMIAFSRRAQKAVYLQLEGQTGAAARALTMLRKGWNVEQVVGFTKQQDLVHRVVGPPGIVLVAEGNYNRVRPLLISEHKKHERVAGDYPVHDVIVGDGEGQVPLPRLTRHIQRLGRTVKPAEMTDLLNRLRALDSQRGKAPIPKGPVPTSMKGQRGNLRGR
ncbi:MAG: DUF4191 domain-containing protein [Nocardioidaceae bacterium]|nr:DUF4191 domain-containing protein [Nocardioidaceae bacterium]MCL2611658.1 DUF4191 domain-containing protein [Nocardioidaceae bacterium]